MCVGAFRGVFASLFLSLSLSFPLSLWVHFVACAGIMSLLEAMITFNKDDGFTEAVVRGYKTQGAGE